jgi:oligopeptide transport system permease protein
MKKMSFRLNKEEELGDKLNEELKQTLSEGADGETAINSAEQLSEEELFSPAQFDEAAVERIGYSNYSYWRCTFNAFVKRKFAMVLVALLVLIIGFAVIQPFLPNQHDPNYYNFYTDEKGREKPAQNIKPYLSYKINSALNSIGLVDDEKLVYSVNGGFDMSTGKIKTIKLTGEEYFQMHGKYLLGTNGNGQDLWARLWAGTRNSLFIGICVALVEAFLGILVGVIWGYVRKLDFILTEVYNVLDNIPNTILLILISYILKPGISTLIFAMCLTGWIQMARFIRNQILIIRDRDYNTASRCLGTPTFRILYKNCLPYLVSVIMLRIALTIPAVIGSEVFITYIGLGLPLDIPSLGSLIDEGRALLSTTKSYQLFYPVILLSFVTISFYVIGNAFSDSADPKNHR